MIRALVPLLILAQALAFDPPTGIAAFVLPERDETRVLDPASLPCGGALVVIGRDGSALTLGEALPAESAEPGRAFPVIISGLRRTATVVRRGPVTGAVLLRIDRLPEGVLPLSCASSQSVAVGDEVWSAGNGFGAAEQDGMCAISRGTVSGLYAIPDDSPPVRGRGGRVLSTYRGPAIEVDAAVNDGDQGGALLNAQGGLIGLVSLGIARERRLGTVVPIDRIAADLGLPAPPAPTRATVDAGSPLSMAARKAAGALVLVSFDRPKGPGNPQPFPRPSRTTDSAPAWERGRLQEAWNAYWHQQQIFFTDQPVCALVVGADELVTSVSNLHGQAKGGRVLLPGRTVPCTVVAIHRGFDLALLRTEAPLGIAPAELATTRPAPGTTLGLLGRHGATTAWTMTSGIVSAVDRRFGQSPQSYVQTDARANYGNLGGALVDERGLIAGLIVMLGPDERFPWLINSGVALFVDAASIAAALPGLRQGRSVEESQTIGLGVMIVPGPRGRLMVQSVRPGSGAAKAGLQAGDLIEQADGIAVVDHQALTKLLMRHRLGDTVTLSIRRAGRPLRINVELTVF